MEIYILRHAIAIPAGSLGYPNDDRPLTEEGVQKMEKEARGMAEVIPHLDVILTSPLKRAHHTARIVADVLRCKANIKILKQLLPGTSIKDLLASLEKFNGMERVMVVGHEPDLSQFASSLLGINTSVVEFKKGALCRIDVEKIPPVKPGQLIWHLPPKQLRMLAKK